MLHVAVSLVSLVQYGAHRLRQLVPYWTSANSHIWPCIMLTVIFYTRIAVYTFANYT